MLSAEFTKLINYKQSSGKAVMTKKLQQNIKQQQNVLCIL